MQAAMTYTIKYVVVLIQMHLNFVSFVDANNLVLLVPSPQDGMRLILFQFRATKREQK